jgi:hypothetical protein
MALKFDEKNGDNANLVTPIPLPNGTTLKASSPHERSDMRGINAIEKPRMSRRSSGLRLLLLVNGGLRCANPPTG